MKEAKEIIKALFDEQHARQAQTYSSLFSGWSRIAGEDIASHSRIVDVKNGAVLVEVDHPGWLQMIRLRERRILTALRKRYAALAITRLKIHVAEEPHDVRADQASGEPAPPPNGEEVDDLRGKDSEEYREFQELLDRVKSLGKGKGKGKRRTSGS